MGPRSTDSPVFNNASMHDMRGVGRQPSEDRSGGDSVHTPSYEAGGSAATPSSVMVGSPLTRELSDLSGSYVNGSPLPHSGRGGVPRNIFSSPRESPLTLRQPWRQAYLLSSPAPADGPAMPVLSTLSQPDEMIMVERNGGVEVVPPEVVALPARRHLPPLPTGVIEKSHSSRHPIVIVLMHPGSKSYELLRLWLDLANDTVRDVLQTIRQNLPHRWNQDYDGLVQPRGSRLSQLINCLRIRQFATVPHEIWVAKPWALSADHTTKYADNLLDHLKSIGLVHSNNCESPRRGGGDTPPTGPAYGVLSLSPAARKRIYAPGGVLTHHHAMQYLTFCPPFESPLPPTRPMSPPISPTPRPTSPSPPSRSPTPPPASPTPDSEVASHTPSDARSHMSIDLVCEPDPSRSKSPELTTTETSSQPSQGADWDDGTVKMTANLRRDGNRRFSLQNLASSRSMHRRRSSEQSWKRAQRIRSLGSCLSGLNCTKRARDDHDLEDCEPRSDILGSQEFSSQEFSSQEFSSYTMSMEDSPVGHEHLLTLYEVEEVYDSEDERSMAHMPLLNTIRGASIYDEFMA